MEIYWIPGHKGVEGKEKVDEGAKEAAGWAGTLRCLEQFTSLTHVRCTVTERKWKESMNWFKTENDRRTLLQSAQYDLALKSQGPDTEAIERASKVSRRYFQLKSVHTVMDTYLQRIGIAETDRCRECTS